MLNIGGTFSTALLRAGMCAALVTVAAMIALYVTSSYGFLDKPELAVGFTAFTATGFWRAIVEGASDAKRQDEGDVKPGDVTPNVVVTTP
jgi:hypothetical protein